LAVRFDKAAAQADAHALLTFFGGEIYGAYQNCDGEYPGRQRLHFQDLEAHFQGEITIAIACVRNGRGNVIAFDLDLHFSHRLPLIAAELDRRGLAPATICTSGSDPERGKAIVFFAATKSQQALVNLGAQIRDAAARHPGWGIAPTSRFSIFPTYGEGGLVRIGGVNRSPRRNARGLDIFLSLHGEPKRLSQVVPARCLHMSGIGRAEPAPQQLWVEDCLSREWTYAGGSRALFNRLVRLAGEAWRLYGPAGYEAIARWADRIWENSPEIRGPSPSGDKRSERSWDRRWGNAWAHIVKTKTPVPNDEVTLSSPGVTYEVGLYNVTSAKSPRARILCSLEQYCDAKGITRDAVAISYRQLGDIVGLSPKTTWKYVQALVTEGRLVIHDRGTRGRWGLPTILGIVRPDEDAAHVLERGRNRGNVRTRIRLRDSWAARIGDSRDINGFERADAHPNVVSFTKRRPRCRGLDSANRARAGATTPSARRRSDPNQSARHAE
jgi:hypothetical protein